MGYFIEMMKVLFLALVCIAVVSAAKDKANCKRWIKPGNKCEIKGVVAGSSGFVQMYIARICPESCPDSVVTMKMNKKAMDAKTDDKKTADPKMADDKVKQDAPKMADDKGKGKGKGKKAGGK